MSPPPAADRIHWHSFTVRADAMRDFSEAANDANPIHVDRAIAKALGFGERCINPGPVNLAYLINMMADAEPDCDLREIDATFLGNVHEGDVVEATGTFDPDRPGSCDAELRIRGEGVPVLRATMRIERRRPVD